MPPTPSARPVRRVLWVTDEPPDVAGGGGNIRQSHLLRALAARVPTTLLLVGHLGDEAVRAVLEEVVELPHPGLVVPATELSRRARTLANAIAGRRPFEHRLTRDVRRVLAPAVAACHDAFDLVVVVHPQVAAVLPPGRTAPAAIELQHLRSTMFEQQRAADRGGRRAWLHGREARQAARVEREAVARYDVTVVCSDDDAGRVRALGARQVVVAPNGVDVERFVPSPVPAGPTLVLPGTLDYEPNLDGLRWFCDEVLPAVRVARPDVELHVVGRRPTPAVRALAGRPGVELHADVPAVVPHLAGARAVLVPLRVGTGTRLKALEAMAASRPVIGTSIGLEGLHVVAGEHALVEDDPAGFAAAVVRVLDDDALASRLARAGRALVEQRYGWAGIGARYADDLLAAVHAEGAR